MCEYGLILPGLRVCIIAVIILILDKSKSGRSATCFEGYLSSAKVFLSPREVALLPQAGQVITYEIGLRFLTDWLEGDVYFKCKRPNHNLERARTQFKLVHSITAQLPAMRQTVTQLS